MSSFCRFLLLPFVVLAMLGCSKPNYIRPNNVNLKYEGRVVVNDDSASFCYPGTSVRVGFTGAFVSAELKANAGYYDVMIDTFPSYKLSTFDADSNRSRKSFILADSLKTGEHTLQLTLVSEGIFDKPQFYGFSLSNNGRFFKTPSKRHSIEFIGDSQTCGYGVEAANEKEHFNDSTSNTMKSFAGLVAKNFEAELMMVARSGIGMYRNYNGDIAGSDTSLPLFYEQSLIFDSPKWDFSSFTPEIVCICLGTNDLSVGPYDIERFKRSYVRFVERLSDHYPEAKIILVGGAMLQGFKFLDQKNALDSVAYELNKKRERKVSRFDFTPQDGCLGYGADWHPSISQHKKMSDELSSFIESIDSSWIRLR